MSLNSYAQAAADPGFLLSVRQAVIATALTTSAEANTVTNHANRSALATRLLNYLSDQACAAWAQAVASDGATLPGAATDTNITNRVAVLWNAFAGGL